MAGGPLTATEVKWIGVLGIGTYLVSNLPTVKQLWWLLHPESAIDVHVEALEKMADRVILRLPELIPLVADAAKVGIEQGVHEGAGLLKEVVNEAPKAYLNWLNLPQICAENESGELACFKRVAKPLSDVVNSDTACTLAVYLAAGLGAGLLVNGIHRYKGPLMQAVSNTVESVHRAILPSNQDDQAVSA